MKENRTGKKRYMVFQMMLAVALLMGTAVAGVWTAGRMAAAKSPKISPKSISF